MMIDPVAVKSNEAVWHDQSYIHPQLGVLTQRDFYNREQEKARIEQVVKTRHCRTVAIVGERRSGKTSLLKCIAHRLSNDPSGQFLTILIPWQGMQSRDTLADEILYGISTQVLKVCPNAPPATLEHTPATDAEFIDTLAFLLALVPDHHTIICIDEFDSIVEEAPPAEQPNLLRLITLLSERGDLHVSLLLTITGETERLTGLRSAPLLNHAERIRIHPFAPDVFAEMVAELGGAQAALTRPEISQLYALSGGWPYFGKLLLIALAAKSRDGNRLAQATSVALQNPNVTDTLINIYSIHFDNDEKAMMLLLAQSHGRVDAGELDRFSPTLHVAATTLAERDFVVHHDDGSYSFRIAMLAEWFPLWPRYAEEIARRLCPLREGYTGNERGIADSAPGGKSR